jgi:hypothetical protein
MRRATVTVMFCLSGAGCTMVGDTGFKVEGRLKLRNAESPKCVLQLHQIGRESPVGYRSISTPFEAEFVIHGGKQQYFFVVSCPDGALYRTKLYELGGSNSSPLRIMLGELEAAT